MRRPPTSDASHTEEMDLFDFMRYLFDNDFDGHNAQRYFAQHPMQPVVVVTLYLVLVRYGPRWMSSRTPFRLKTVSRCWNFSVALFSICGALVCVPHLIRQLLGHGFWYSVCANVYELAGYGPPALWAAAFTWSKLFELFDTALLVLKKRPVITLHWFHHASVIGFAWAAWAYETPAALWYGAMNYSVHALMYTYFALTSVDGCRDSVLRFARTITTLQISQFAFGTVINGFAAVAYLTPGVGCAIHPFILQLAAALYVAYGALFVRLFVARYLRPKQAPHGGAAHAADARMANDVESWPSQITSSEPLSSCSCSQLDGKGLAKLLPKGKGKGT